MSGKGSKPRPLSVDQKTFDENWNRIFNSSNQYSKKVSPDDFEIKQTEFDFEVKKFTS